jgi:hypothetical protein
MMKHGEDYNYQIIKHNSRSGDSIPVNVVRGISEAISAVDYYNDKLSGAEKEQGWGHFHKRTTRPLSRRPVQHHGYKPGPRKRAT